MFSKKKSKTGLDVLLTTYPEQGSRNVGDKLISASAIKLIRYRVKDYDPVMVFREEPLERFDNISLRTILAPGFSVNDATYPTLFRLYENIQNLPDTFFPVGCSFQHLVPKKDTYDQYNYSDTTLSIFESIVERSGPLPCRDELIVKMLNRNGVPAFYCGDLALYDDDVIGSKFVPPTTIKSLVFTVQHKPKYMQQSFAMLDLIKKEFPAASLYVVHHSKINKYSKQVSEYAKSVGFIEKDLSGEVSNLEFYDKIDLHIGYRLHGHISFLRRRKPSCLLIEDSRSFGVANTEGLNYGAFNALKNDGVNVDEEAPAKLIQYVKKQVENGFKDYLHVFRFIDKSYRSVVRPYFDQLACKLGWNKYSIRRLLDYK
ncbi:polysaccharide pyruvyl transferase family protein [Pseudomonas sp. NPDC077408]